MLRTAPTPLYTIACRAAGRAMLSAGSALDRLGARRLGHGLALLGLRVVERGERHRLGLARDGRAGA